jgi:hypothetical protein
MTLSLPVVPATEFKNIQVAVSPGAAPGQFIVVCNPLSITITSPDTVINYQIVSTAGHNISFAGMSKKPDHTHQLSDPSISVSGKLLTFSDANTTKEDLHVTLKFKDSDGTPFSHDPQIKNDPVGPS